jgi:hypothetical protein
MIESEFDLHPLQVIWYYLSKFLGLLVFFFILRHFWGEYMLLDLGDLKGKGGVSFSGLGHIWWFGLWALAAGILSAIVSSNTIYVDDKPTAMLKGWWLSINAGIWEELIYRWLLFVTSMVVLPFLNYITLGLVKWFFGTLFVPFANFMSFHSLEAQLHYGPWFFGAALVSAAADFRKAHNHLGPLGAVNAWFLGLLLFYVMFHYGIFTAIVAHILYDLVVFTMVAWAADTRASRFSFR